MTEPGGGFDDFVASTYNSDTVKQTWQAQRQLAFETRAMRRLLACCGLDSVVQRELVRRSHQLRGKECLTCQAFEEAYGRFPYRLATRLVPFVHELDLPALAKGFTKTRLFLTWAEVYEELGNYERPLALIFDWPKLSLAVMHNSGVLTVGPGTLTLVRQIDDLVLMIEPLPQFLERFGDSWK